MKIRKMVGMPDLVTNSAPWMLPDGGDPTAGGTNGGAGTPVVTPTPAAPTPTPQTPAAGAPAAVGPNGFPESTPVAEMTDGQAAAYWRFHAKRHRTEAEQNAAELESLRPKAQQYDALAAASRTDHEHAIEAARTEAATAAKAEALAEARRTYGAQLVQVRLDAALTAKGLSAEQMAALAGDTTRFLGADGVDTAALDAFLAALPDKAAAPVAPVDLGGGRTAPVTSSGIDAGRALYEARKTKPKI